MPTSEREEYLAHAIRLYDGDEEKVAAAMVRWDAAPDAPAPTPDEREDIEESLALPPMEWHPVGAAAPDGDLRERLARALYDTDPEYGRRDVWVEYGEQSEQLRGIFRARAARILALLRRTP